VIGLSPYPSGSARRWRYCVTHRDKYADQQMDLADACLVAMSEKWWDCKVVTVDVADFKVYRRRGRHAIPLLTPNAS
jgi:predicted nucleic acid-binding protein